MSRKYGLVFAAMLALAALPATAQTSEQDLQHRMEERCAADPAGCEKFKARMQEAKKKCEADPAACEEKKKKLQERMKKRQSSGD